MSKDQKQLRPVISFVRKDAQGNPHQFMNINRDNILSMDYDVSHNLLGVTLSTVKSEAHLFGTRPKFPKKKEETPVDGQPAPDAVSEEEELIEFWGTETVNDVLFIRDQQTMLQVINQFCGTNYTMDTYEGFKVHAELRRKWELAMDQKRKEEEEANQSRIINPNAHEPTSKGGIILPGH